MTEQRVDDARFNVLATIAGAAAPVVVFSTHFDCVPPFFPSRVEGGRIYGRGSCDAKGILAAQVAAAELLRQDGETRVGLLFVVGEERGSDGARRGERGRLPACRYLVNGEPTDSRLGLATRGILRLRLKATGRAAHSSFPELGESAIDKLIDALDRAAPLELPVDPVLGRTHYIVGLISGGVAPNVVSPSAEGEVMFRTVSLTRPRCARAIRSVEARVQIEHVLEVPPVRLTTVPGFETAVFPYTTDIPFLDALGAAAAFRSRVDSSGAHRGRIHRDRRAQRAAVDGYVRIARHCCSVRSGRVPSSRRSPG